MTIDHDTDLLTIAEAAKLLKVSTVTIHRWLKAGRLPSYRVGQKSVRIRRGDLAAVVTPLADTPTSEAQPWHVHTSLDTIRPLTKGEQRRAREALLASEALIARMRARRGGVPYAESWPVIRDAREERSQQQL
jgi:excisionase family DNA binding protein